MDKNNTIVVDEYSPGWQTAFTQLEEVYRSRLGSYVVGIEHVGSTSVEGLPAKPILDIDLIIIATHGHTGLRHALLGSTAERVVRHAPCPVLTVREREHDFA